MESCELDSEGKSYMSVVPLLECATTCVLKRYKFLFSFLFFCMACVFVGSHDESSPVGMWGRGLCEAEFSQLQESRGQSFGV